MRLTSRSSSPEPAIPRGDTTQEAHSLYIILTNSCHHFNCRTATQPRLELSDVKSTRTTNAIGYVCGSGASFVVVVRVRRQFHRLRTRLWCCHEPIQLLYFPILIVVTPQLCLCTTRSIAIHRRQLLHTSIVRFHVVYRAISTTRIQRAQIDLLFLPSPLRPAHQA